MEMVLERAKTNDTEVMAERAETNGAEVVSEKEYHLIQELIKTRMETNRELEYENFDGYELPPSSQFSMLKKPAVTIKFGKITFNMAAIRLFDNVRYILPMVNAQKKRFAAVPCAEEEMSSVEWARIRAKDNARVNKQITSVDFTESIFRLMGWNRECRYKIVGRMVNSDRGLILVFDMEEAIMFEPQKEEYTDPATGETKKRDVKYYPNFYKDKIGRSYQDYMSIRQLSLFEDTESYSDSDELLAENRTITNDNTRPPVQQHAETVPRMLDHQETTMPEERNKWRDY